MLPWCGATGTPQFNPNAVTNSAHFVKRTFTRLLLHIFCKECNAITCMLQNSMGKPVRASLRHELLGGARESGACRSRRGVETDRRHCQGDGVRHPALVDDGKTI